MLDKVDEKLLSPGMRQYKHIKDRYPDCILLNRMGDFYEMFFDDAIVASRELDLVLTVKQCGLPEKAPMCGVPFHAVQTYIAKLVANGHKVAICEQLTQPQKGVKMVDRDVVRVITPGTLIDEEMLEGQRNNYLMSLYKNGGKIGVSYVDISTGEFDVLLIEGGKKENELSDLIARVMPAEVIGNIDAKAFYEDLGITKLQGIARFNEYYEWAFDKQTATDTLKNQFGENFESVYELSGKPEIICGAGALFEYLKETQKRSLTNINKIEFVKNTQFMTIDLNTRRNLEIVESSRERKKYGSILWVLDKTKTSMGARCLRKMVDEPLQNAKEINERLDGVEELSKKLILRDRLTELLSDVYDIERLSGKIAYGSIQPGELNSLKRSLAVVPQVKKLIGGGDSAFLKKINAGLVDMQDIVTLLNNAISEELSYAKDTGFIKRGFNKELDEYKDARTEGKKWLNELQDKEIEATGIKNLKISYNRVFGFFIEVNKSQLDKVPLRYQRKQTVSNNERYITEELKAIEDKILGSEEKAIQLEGEIFAEIKRILMGYIRSIQQTASALANLDAILSLAVVAVKNNYTKPTINSSVKALNIVEGRHPVVEQFLTNGRFVANDTYLDETESKIMIITGPNMAGKSTYMRQVAIIALLAHIGSFVPAKEATIPIIDRIFTRVGASDDLAFGQSTFMVEMSEVAHILANATNKSLIILDEIGRGTSTFDGLSIAWSVVEHISKHFGSKTLFATHYHELTELEGVLDGVKNYKIAVKEVDDRVVFLRKIVRGGANKSFGIEVARLAGLPAEVLSRSKEISENLEAVNQKLDVNLFKERKNQAQENTKLALSILSILRDVDINRVSPMSAFDLLNDLVGRAKEGIDEN
ncbi:MAG: DNA mismatch repair protein MutS [Clostridia bacterium]|nr:DNA mismatch repair protein MutS [Clostridia bacterium]